MEARLYSGVKYAAKRFSNSLFLNRNSAWLAPVSAIEHRQAMQVLLPDSI